ncbi:MAG: hypothetical protein BWY63_03228 [Chloroflexi bacterium ADurb.Bin360]|nr:MAG: hypothetical protein BWY63_03228 [Chloroflexi bacterium ADurb.Bin360]
MSANKTIPTCGACQFFKPAHQDFGACICPFVPKHIEREANAACVYWTAQPAGPKGRVLDLHDGATPEAPQIAHIKLLQNQHWISLQILDLDAETVIGEVLLEHYEGAVVTRVWDDMDGEPIHEVTHLITAVPAPAPVPVLVEA